MLSTRQWLKRNGVTLHGLRFYNIELFLAWCIHGGVEVELQFDPRDLSAIQVVEPSSGTLVSAQCV